MENHTKNTVVIALAFVLAVIPIISQAQIPRTLSYQGVLTDSSGNPKPDGAYSFTFCIYDSPGGGTNLWCGTITSLQVTGGLFSTVLGPFDTTVHFDKPYWLEITADGELLTPRLPLSSAAYSLNPTSGGFTNFQVFDTPGSYTFIVPAGVTKIMAEVWGAGGGGGGADTGAVRNGVTGGGGGGYAKDIFEVVPGSTYYISCGQGGTGGSIAQPGTKGGKSYFGLSEDTNVISADGGQGGNSVNGGASGAGGTGHGRIYCNGSVGWVFTGGSACNGGAGGIPGTAGNLPGGGGGQGQGNPVGGNGAAGRVIVWW
ncbi:MAG: hypothetical protein ACHQQQ_06365 [Bacteroidota bacterium]